MFNNSIPLKILKLYLIICLLVSCRGQKSTEPPILPIQNMVEQTSYPPQSKNSFYKDGRAARSPVAGTVAQGEAKVDSRYYDGVEPNSDSKNPVWVKQIPIKLNESLLKRGQENYNIYCSPCHGYSGSSDGLATQLAGGSIRPTNILDKDRRALPAGQIYSAISNGVNNWNMPGFNSQISVEDRWAVVAYVRALQLAKNATLNDVPNEVRAKNGWSEKK